MDEIQEAAGNRVEWVSLDEGNFSALLLVSGCDKQCAEMAEYEKIGCRVISVKDTGIPPRETLSRLLEEGDD